MVVVTNSELVECFGERNVIVMNYEKGRRVGISDRDMQILSRVGIPRNAGAVYTADVVGSPSFFAVRKFKPEGKEKKVLFLGGPKGDERMRYFLDLEDGFVALIGFYDDGPQVEVVNSNLGSFIEFVYLFGSREVTAPPESVKLRDGKAQELEGRLREVDSWAFRRPDAWWSMALDEITKN